MKLAKNTKNIRFSYNPSDANEHTFTENLYRKMLYSPIQCLKKTHIDMPSHPNHSNTTTKH